MRPGLLVTPGFIDLHTHYDGQAIWSDRMTPSSAHGVTTAVMGNCGVGFAPCRAEDHEVLVDVMAGVEDIPGVVMVDGLPWDWETFPEYLDALDSRQRDIDVAAYLPHSPLRVYVMGQRGADREPATDDDLEQMRELAKEAIEVGALGFASSRFSFHKTASGELIPTYDAAQAEIAAIADGVADGGGGLIQFVPDIAAGGYANVLQQVFEAAQDAGLPVTFTLGNRQLRRPDLARRDHADREVQLRWQPGHRDHRSDVPSSNRFGHRARADRQPVRVLPELPRNRRSAAGGASGRDAQTRSARTHPGRQACRRRPSAALPGAGVGLDLPADRRPDLRAGPVDLHCGAGPAHAASAPWRRPTTGCSTTTATPCCWWQWPTSRTTRSTRSGS